MNLLDNLIPDDACFLIHHDEPHHSIGCTGAEFKACIRAEIAEQIKTALHGPIDKASNEVTCPASQHGHNFEKMISNSMHFAVCTNCGKTA